MDINLIVAYDNNKGIGKNGKIPWYNSEDLKYFKQITTKSENGLQNIVVMGRKTWNSLKKPLINRINVVLSKNKNFNSEKCIVFNNFDDLLVFLQQNSFKKIFVIGGESIYKLFIDNNLCKTLYISKILGKYNCDTFFPEHNIKNIIVKKFFIKKY